jgi:hypothetical protein
MIIVIANIEFRYKCVMDEWRSHSAPNARIRLPLRHAVGERGGVRWRFRVQGAKLRPSVPKLLLALILEAVFISPTTGGASVLASRNAAIDRLAEFSADLTKHI